jgi:hypothetical protein
MRADFRIALPASWLLWGELVFAIRAAPLALRASMTEEIAPNVVRTRPGWMGEW